MIKDAFDLHYRLGISDVDEEHWHLLDSVANINRLIKEGDKKEAQVKIFILRTALLKHFQHEEVLMEISGFPFIEAHKADHVRGINSLDKIYNHFDYFACGMRNYLQDFEIEMMKHLDYMDMQYVSYVKAWLLLHQNDVT